MDTPANLTPLDESVEEVIAETDKVADAAKEQGQDQVGKRVSPQVLTLVVWPLSRSGHRGRVCQSVGKLKQGFG